MHNIDFRPMFYLAIFGLVCGAVIATTGGLWLGYHLLKAVALYLGLL